MIRQFDDGIIFINAIYVPKNGYLLLHRTQRNLATTE